MAEPLTDEPIDRHSVIHSGFYQRQTKDTDDESLVFLIVKQPRYGVLQLKGQPATKVTQEEVKDGLVSYLHTSGETGTSSQKDSVSFIVSDQNYLASSDLPVYDLNITITPVNNQKPVIQVIIIIINLIYIAQFDTNGILTALYIVITYIQIQYVHV